MRNLIEMNNPEISIRKQCEMLGLNRANVYYEPTEISDYNLLLMNLIDKQYLETPFYGIRRMTKELDNKGYKVNHKRVRRLMRINGLEAIYPRGNLSKKNNEHKIYPYLLKGVSITRPNQVWSTDITYIRMAKGFIYLVAVIDWWSRYVLSWRVSTTLDIGFCLEALKAALEINCPDIFNTDQGSQFTAEDFINILLGKGIRISMDGRGRVFNNIFIERLWRTVKYEEVYLKDYDGVKDAIGSLDKYFHFYNERRIHQALDYKTPREVYFNLRRKETLEKKKVEPRIVDPNYLNLGSQWS